MLNNVDRSISKKIQTALSGRRGDEYIDQWHERFWELMSSRGALVYAVIMIGLLLLLQDHRVLMWLVPVFVTAVSTILLQAIIKRPRPDRSKGDYKPFLPTYSFPSNHAASSFAFATVLSYAFLSSSLEVAWLYVLAFYALALFISISRVVVGVHYFGDIVAGAIFGTCITIVLLGF